MESDRGEVEIYIVAVAKNLQRKEEENELSVLISLIS